MAVRNLRQLLPLYVACYVIVLVLAAMGVWLIFTIQPLLFRLSVWLRLNPWQVRAVDNFSVVTMGLIWLIGVLILEYRLRRGVEQNRLWIRALWGFAIVAVPLGLGNLILAVIGQ